MAIAKETRQIDSKGRIQIPKHVLEISNIDKGDTVVFDITKAGSIVLRKYCPKLRVTREYDNEDGIRCLDIGVEENGK